MLYAIRERLEAVEALPVDAPYVAVLTGPQWERGKAGFELGIDIEPGPLSALDVSAEVNYDSVTGVIRVPDRSDLAAPGTRFAFALDERGVVFIDDGDTALSLVEDVARRGRWRRPGLERFLYDFLLLLVRDDPALLASYERELDRMEAAISTDEHDIAFAERVNEMRGDMRDLDDYLEHLQDFAAVLEENENGFFADENLRYFRLFTNRVEKMRDKVRSLREQAAQLRDLYKMHLDIRQNNIMTVFTVVTAIFAPLTLIVGWYGMNFEHMPELSWPLGYPAVAVACLLVAAGLVAFFRRRRWL